jgi:hypothetical protein
VNSRRLISALWFRLVVVIAFSIFVAVQQMWIVTAVAVLLAVLTIWQLWSAYKNQ